MPNPKPIHIMWYEHEGWCGAKGIHDFTCMASRVNPPTCKSCLKSPFNGEFYSSDKLSDCYGNLFLKYMARFNLTIDEMPKRTAIMLLEQAKQQV